MFWGRLILFPDEIGISCERDVKVDKPLCPSFFFVFQVDVVHESVYHSSSSNDSLPPGQMTTPSLFDQYHVGQALAARVLHSEDVVQKKDSNLVFRLLELGLLDDKNSQRKAQDGDAASGAADDDAVPAVAWWGESTPKQGEVHRLGVVDLGRFCKSVLDRGITRNDAHPGTHPALTHSLIPTFEYVFVRYFYV